MSRKKFDINLLTDEANKYEATILNNPIKLCRTSVINFKCSCEKEFSKTFRMIVEGAGMLCDTCIKKNSLIKIQNKKDNNLYIKSKRYKYTLELLQEIIKRDGAELCDNYSKLNSESIIKFKCKCNEIYNKTFRQIKNVSGAYCKQCTFINQQNKDNRLIYNSDLLNITLLRDNAKLISTYNNLKKLTQITYTCSCGKNNTKSFYYIYMKQALCKDCSLKSRLQNMQNTCEIRYGVKNPTQHPDILDKAFENAKKYKKYKMPSGIIRHIQGYEHFALNELIKKYNEDDIKTKRSDIPRILYYYNNNKKYYFPDIFIPFENKIIEVKSDWTIKINPDIIKLKAEACINNKYNYEIWIYDDKGNKTIKTT